MQVLTISFWVSSELLKSVLEDLEHCCLSSWRYFLRQGWTGELCSKRNKAGGSSLLSWGCFDVALKCSKATWVADQGFITTFHVVNMWHCYFQSLQLSFESRLRTQSLWVMSRRWDWCVGSWAELILLLSGGLTLKCFNAALLLEQGVALVSWKRL